ncbi:NAD(P)/FAD-dependent oxidoreductase [Shouchella lehensis]|uniref:Pyridine nucleotide-disulfide oxidoreductase n=1 Tax=Shouchella lehensis G1 TaxID=1246626 RepID=A0A060LZS9_9BACI|nr:NAD(P)/FAD-dependent oxidoreductase [Shouchella lehensis]AIC93324.1 pyridine nucleotide-disulfide oxidoreductase [Shouchella lehensis G1]
MIDTVIIGGGPAGLSAALVLGRGKRSVTLFDDANPRNQVTQHSHGYLTQDGVTPTQFRQKALADLRNYPSIKWEQQQVKAIEKRGDGTFKVKTEKTELVARKILLATGLKDVLPDVPDIHDYYGTSLFPCPFCDGWELKDQPLVVISENDHASMFTTLITNWSRDLVLATNGKSVLSTEQKEAFAARNIQVIEEKIQALKGKDGQLHQVQFTNGLVLERSAGFVTCTLKQASLLANRLGCKENENGGYETDGFGQTTVSGVYATGDMTMNQAPQLILAAADGSMVAASIVKALAFEDFETNVAVH